MSVHLFDGGTEVFEFHSDLAEGSLKNMRRKFSVSQQSEALEGIVSELEDGSIYLGSVADGEIEIIGINRVISNRYWTEVEYAVLFPGKNGGSPNKGSYRCIRWNVGRNPGAAALCITEDRRIVLTRSFRHASRGWRLEIPRGAKTPGESAANCALREGLEEAGVMPGDKTEAHELGVIEPDSGLAMQAVDLVAFTNMTVDTSRVKLDVSEAISGHLALSREEVESLIMDGTIVDAFTIAAIFKATLLGLL